MYSVANKEKRVNIHNYVFKYQSGWRGTVQIAFLAMQVFVISTWVGKWPLMVSPNNNVEERLTMDLLICWKVEHSVMPTFPESRYFQTKRPGLTVRAFPSLLSPARDPVHSFF